MSEKQRHTMTSRPATQAEAQEPGNRFEGEVKPPQPRAEPPETNDATPDPDQQNREEFDRLLTNNPDLPESASLTPPPNSATGTPQLAWFSATTPDHVSKLYFFTPAQSSDAPPQYVPYSDALTTLTPIAQDSSNPDYPAANTLLQRIHQQRPDLGTPPPQQANQPQTQQTTAASIGNELSPDNPKAAIQARQRRATEQQSTPAIPPEEFAQRSPPPRNTTSGPQPATKIVTPQAAPAPQPPQPKSSTNT